jgi:hypothetical protein
MCKIVKLAMYSVRFVERALDFSGSVVQLRIEPQFVALSEPAPQSVSCSAFDIRLVRVTHNPAGLSVSPGTERDVV